MARLYPHDYARLQRDFPYLLPTDRFQRGLGPGWAPLLRRLCLAILRLGVSQEVVFSQIKQKFGELRCSFSGSSREVRTLSRYARIESRAACERCGDDGRLAYLDSWMTSVCQDCFDMAAANDPARDCSWYNLFEEDNDEE
ncbi:hypothetical protein MKEN_00951300 [Mycena kentingensis (nom. inval.)]|nr:hypothetical protein MKEN_00951300 [Mycena kentingensis (nom. inval.)]